MPNPRTRSFVGIGLETTKGTAVAATDYIPVDTFEFGDNVKFLEDKAVRGSAVEVYNEIAGPIFSEVSLGGPVFVESIPRLVYSLMGELATSGGSAPYTHTFSILNTGDQQGKGYTLVDYNGTVARNYPGCQVSELTFKWNADGLFEWTGKAVGYPSATLTAPTASFNASPAQPAWAATLTLGGSSVTRMEQGEITLSRATGPIFTVAGTQSPYKVWQGPLSVKGKMTLVYEDDTDLTRFLTQTNPAAVIALSQGSGASTRSATFTMTKCAFVTPTRIMRGKDYAQLDVSIAPFANTTDVGTSAGYGPVKVAFSSAISAYTT